MTEFTADDACRILNVSRQALHTFRRAALIETTGSRGPRRFSFQDLLLLKTAKGLRDAGVPVSRIRRVLHSLKQQLPPDQLLSTVKIYADGRRVVVWDGQGRWQPDSGQFLLNFEAQSIAPTRSLRTRPSHGRRTEPTLSAEQWLERATQLHADSPEEARHAYEEALARDPSLSDANINLGLLHHEAGRLAEAERCYRAALEYEADSAVASFNLGVLLEERGEVRHAMAAYRQAVARAPDFKDAHHHLARLYEQEGRRVDAIRHYAAAKALDGRRPKKRR